MKKYALLFALAYLAFTLILGFVTTFLKIDGGLSLNAAATLTANFVAAWKFAKDQKRTPTPEETGSYTWLALLSIWVVTLLLLVAAFVFYFSPEEINLLLTATSLKMFPFLVITGSIIVSIINYIVLRWTFSWFVKKLFNRLYSLS